MVSSANGFCDNVINFQGVEIWKCVTASVTIPSLARRRVGFCFQVRCIGEYLPKSVRLGMSLTGDNIFKQYLDRL